MCRPLQVPRILNPVVSVLDELPVICERDTNIRAYIHSTFGSVDACRRHILTDFCRHAFDGACLLAVQVHAVRGELP